MAQNIKSFDQCRRAVAGISASLNDVLDFLNYADNAVTAVNNLKGGQRSEKAEVGTVPPHQNGSEAGGLVHRVLSVFKEANKPLAPVEVLNLYAKHDDWPSLGDARRRAYIKVNGAIRYLAFRKKVLEKTEAGPYKLKT